MPFFRKFKRRNVFRAAVAFVIIAWLLPAGLDVASRIPIMQPLVSQVVYLMDRLRLEFWYADPEHPLEAVFNDPSGLFVDRAGTIFFSERRNHVIRRIDGDRITRLAGTGRSGFTGDGRSAASVRLDFPEGLVRVRLVGRPLSFVGRLRRYFTAGTEA